MHKYSQIKSSERRVLVFQAQTPPVYGRNVHFLFSLQQAEDILTDVSIMPVPLSPLHIEGIAEWRSQILPVLSLETSLGLEFASSINGQRMAVIRTKPEHENQPGHNRVMVRMAVPIQMLSLPVECAPASNDGPGNRSFTRGVYEWQDGWLIVVQLEKILWQKI